MTTFKAVSISFLLAFSMPSFAEELSPAKRADIEKLLEVTGALAVGQQMGSAVVGQMTQVLHQARPDIPAEVLNVLPEEVNAVIGANLGAFKAIIIPIYHKYYTASDIKEMLRFYSTPLGQKMIRVMPTLVNESMQAGQQWGQSMGPEIQKRIKARLKKEGYEI